MVNFFLNKISILKKDLLKIGIRFFYIKWKLYGNNNYDIEYFLEEEDLDDNYIIYSEKRLYNDCRNKKGKMHLIQSIQLNLRSQVNNILQKHFTNRTNGITSDEVPIKIYFISKNKIPPEKGKITFLLNIIFKNKTFDKSAQSYINIINKYLKKYKIGNIISDTTNKDNFSIKNDTLYIYIL